MEFNATFLVSAISFVIFTLLMNKILYQPVSEIMRKRQEYLDANSLATETNLKSASNLKSEKEQKLLDARSVAKKALFDEVEGAKLVKSQKESELKAKSMQNRTEHKRILEEEVLSVSGELDSKAHELSDTIVSKLIGGQE